MKEIKVSDECAGMIEALRDGTLFESECGFILDALYELNYMLCEGKTSEVVGRHANRIHKAMDLLLEYYYQIKKLAYLDEDSLKDGEVQVTLAEC